MTKYKKAILDIINSSYNHMDANEVYKELKSTMPNVVLATIYNNLNSLVEEGKIRRISIEGQVDRFDKIILHDHLVCKKCGKLVDFCFDDFSKSLSSQTGRKILGYDLKVYFICDECQKKEEK